MISKLPIDKIIENLLCYVAISFPLYVVGFNFYGYDLSISMLFLIMLDLALLFKGKFNRYVLYSFSLFIIWCFFTGLQSLDTFSYLPSLSALILVTFPLSANWKNIKLNKERLCKYYLYGLYITLGIVCYEIICLISDVQPFYNYISFGIFKRIRFSKYIGINRVKGLFLEPAHLAIYIVFSYVIIDSFEKEIKNKFLIKVTLFVVLMLTFSLTGIIILITYYLCKFFIFGKHKFKNTIKITFVSLVALVALTYFASDYFLLMLSRFDALLKVFKSGSLNRTYGARANAIFVIGKYFNTEGFFKFLVGEGYANYERWLIQNFGYLNLSSLAQGNISNVFAVLTLSTGLIGVSLYIAFLITTVKQFVVKNKKILFVLILILNFGLGFLISYVMWGLILIILLLNQK